ncbi:unnamed protein product [Pedinophyceae sp. YPF-701]|nr:unnamed protein product [Pedinophyceae sp. YPF-701]
MHGVGPTRSLRRPPSPLPPIAPVPSHSGPSTHLERSAQLAPPRAWLETDMMSESQGPGELASHELADDGTDVPMHDSDSSCAPGTSEASADAGVDTGGTAATPSDEPATPRDRGLGNKLKRRVATVWQAISPSRSKAKKVDDTPERRGRRNVLRRGGGNEGAAGSGGSPSRSSATSDGETLAQRVQRLGKKLSSISPFKRSKEEAGRARTDSGPHSMDEDVSDDSLSGSLFGEDEEQNCLLPDSDAVDDDADARQEETFWGIVRKYERSPTVVRPARAWAELLKGAGLDQAKIQLAASTAIRIFLYGYAQDIQKGCIKAGDVPLQELAAQSIPTIATELLEEAHAAVPYNRKEAELCVDCIYCAEPLSLAADVGDDTMSATVERLEDVPHVDAFATHSRATGKRTFGFAALELNSMLGMSRASFADAGALSEYLMLSSPPAELAAYIRAQQNPYAGLCAQRPELRRTIEYVIFRQLVAADWRDARRAKRKGSALARGLAKLGKVFTRAGRPTPEHVDELACALIDTQNGWLCAGSPAGIVPILLAPPGTYGMLGSCSPGAAYAGSLDATVPKRPHTKDNTQIICRSHNLDFKRVRTMADSVARTAKLALSFVSRVALPPDMRSCLRGLSRYFR